MTTINCMRTTSPHYFFTDLQQTHLYSSRKIIVIISLIETFRLKCRHACIYTLPTPLTIPSCHWRMSYLRQPTNNVYASIYKLLKDICHCLPSLFTRINWMNVFTLETNELTNRSLTISIWTFPYPARIRVKASRFCSRCRVIYYFLAGLVQSLACWNARRLRCSVW